MRALGVGVLLSIALGVLVASSGSRAAPRPIVLTCLQSIYPSGTPSRDERVVFEAVTLPRPTLRLHLEARAPGKWRFAKHGFRVRQGRTVTLTVPVAFRSQGLLGAAYVPGDVSSIIFEACPADHLGDWTAWAGGYAVPAPVCLPLVVRSEGRSTRVQISVGRYCASPR